MISAGPDGRNRREGANDQGLRLQPGSGPAGPVEH